MIKLSFLSLAVVLFLAASSSSGNPGVCMPFLKGVPKAATVEIILLKAPGLNDARSQWEIAYDFRIANEAALWGARKQKKSSDESLQRIGDLIKEGAIKESLRSPANRKIVFRIPFSPEIQERLRNQPRERVTTTPGQTTPEEITQLKEQEIRSQVFLFYPVINIYDAKLKRNIIIPYQQDWNYDSYPDARFEIKVELNDDGTYIVNSSPPAKNSSE